MYCTHMLLHFLQWYRLHVIKIDGIYYHMYCTCMLFIHTVWTYVDMCMYMYILVNFLHVYMYVHMQYTVYMYVSISPPCRLLQAFVPRAQLGAPQVLHYTRPVHVLSIHSQYTCTCTLYACEQIHCCNIMGQCPAKSPFWIVFNFFHFP